MNTQKGGEKRPKEINALPIGFAFSDRQFEEMKAKLGVKENSELYRLGSTGGFYRKIDSDLIHGTFDRHAKERRDRIFTPDGIDKEYLEEMFYFEMCNHEFAINHDGTAEVWAACFMEDDDMNVPEIKEAWNTAKKRYYADAEKNDWF